MFWPLVGLWLMISFLCGKLLFIFLERTNGFPYMLWQVIFIVTAFLIFSCFVVYLFLRHHAEINSSNPYFVVDDNGISWSGLGITRDIYISWDNIKKYKGYGSSDYVFRVWTKETHNALKSKSLIIIILGSIINIVSFGLVTKNFELSFYQFKPGLLGLTKLEFQQILDKQMNMADNSSWKPAPGWKNTNNSKLNPIYKLLILAPSLFMVFGFVFEMMF